jgi:hypothetical protein
LWGRRQQDDADEDNDEGASSGDDMDADTAERAALDAKIGAVLRAGADARATAAQARASIGQLKFRVRRQIWQQVPAKYALVAQEKS